MIRSVLILGFMLGLIFTAGIWFIWQDKEAQLNTPLNISSEYILEIKAGTSLTDLAIDLTERGWLVHPNYLIFEARRLKKAHKIKTGEFLVHPGTTPLQLLDQLIEGKVVQYSLTLVEGWNFREIRDALQSSTTIKQTIQDWTPAGIVTLLQLPHPSPEGLFYPDTYHFPRGLSDIEFLHRAHERLHQILDEEWQNRAQELPYKNKYEALIMASIIEKETGAAEERDEIAGVFVRRLNKGMKLQTDPTVIYAIGEAFDGDIRRKDLKIDSPYNTYVYPGLPPTPIAAAGKEAIYAALHPKEGNTLYFVSRGDGTHQFSATLKDHNRAVRKYQLGK